MSLSKEAGALLLKYYDQLEGYEQKGEIDLVTAADQASEAYLVEAISRQFPNDSILAEEGSNREGTSGWQWIMDPLDGTTNFVHSYPFFMVSIGIKYQGEMVSGVCYGPYYNELFSAQKGGGAYLNDKQIHVSNTKSLSNSLIATGFPYNRREIVDELMAPLKQIICTAHGIRRAGAAAYDQCLLAAGRLDGFFERALKPWDVAAGSLIIREAGGVITQYDESPWDIYAPNILASNGRIHKELSEAVIP